jgi:hypothetical protein
MLRLRMRDFISDLLGAVALFLLLFAALFI